MAKGVRPTSVKTPTGEGVGGAVASTGAGGGVAVGPGGGVTTFCGHTMISVCSDMKQVDDGIGNVE